ncbi:MAG: multiprotein-bridging factor 1 family protein [archaeon]
MFCEICGSKAEKMYKVRLEGAELLACERCSQGKLAEPVNLTPKKPQGPSQTITSQPDEFVIKGFGQLIKDYREKLGLTQEELAKRINEQKSTIQKIESNKISISKPVFVKLSKVFGPAFLQEIRK